MCHYYIIRILKLFSINISFYFESDIRKENNNFTYLFSLNIEGEICLFFISFFYYSPHLKNIMFGIF